MHNQSSKLACLSRRLFLSLHLPQTPNRRVIDHRSASICTTATEAISVLLPIHPSTWVQSESSLLSIFLSDSTDSPLFAPAWLSYRSRSNCCLLLQLVSLRFGFVLSLSCRLFLTLFFLSLSDKVRDQGKGQGFSFSDLCPPSFRFNNDPVVDQRGVPRPSFPAQGQAGLQRAISLQQLQSEHCGRPSSPSMCFF